MPGLCKPILGRDNLIIVLAALIVPLETARQRAVSDGTIERGQTNDQVATHIPSAQRR